MSDGGDDSAKKSKWGKVKQETVGDAPEESKASESWGAVAKSVEIANENPYELKSEETVGEGFSRKAVLSQDVDKGIPCNDECPGFDLHVFKRCCKNCGTLAENRNRRKVEKIVDVQKLQFAEEVPEGFDSQGFAYNYNKDQDEPEGEEEDDDDEGEYDAIDTMVKYDEPIKREFSVVTPDQPRARRMMVTFVPKNAARTHQHRNCIRFDEGSGAAPSILLLKVVVRIVKTPSSNGLPGLELEEASVGTYKLTEVSSSEPEAVDGWVASLQKDWVAPTEFAAVRKTTRGGGAAAALMKLKQSKRGASAAAAAAAAAAPPHPPEPAPPTAASSRRHVPAPPAATAAVEYAGSERGSAGGVSAAERIDYGAGGGEGGGGPAAGKRQLVVKDSMTVGELAHETDVGRKDAEELLETERQKVGKGASGMFLLRKSAKTPGAVVISMYAIGKMHHFNFPIENGKYVNNKGRVMGSLPEMLRHYQNSNDGFPCVLGQFIEPTDAAF